VDEERARIARELHDVVGHAVGLMTVQAGAARLVLDTEPDRARESLLAVEAAGRQALAEMRRLLMVLRTDGDSEELGPQPGISDLPALVAQVREAGLPVELIVDGDAAAVTPGLDLAAYRVVQEALTNVRKHSSSAAATVSLRWRPDLVEVDVHDPGPGRRTPWFAPSGFGLRGLTERVQAVGGAVVARREGEGYRVTASVPAEATS
jgi:signal transduction histidine kinase